MAPPRRESELCRGRGRTPEGRGWAGGPEGQAPARPEPGTPPSRASSWPRPPGAQGGKFHTQHMARGPLLWTHQADGPRAPGPRPQAPSHTFHVRWPQTCTSSQTGCSAGKSGAKVSAAERDNAGRGKASQGRRGAALPAHLLDPPPASAAFRRTLTVDEVLGPPFCSQRSRLLMSPATISWGQREAASQGAPTGGAGSPGPATIPGPQGRPACLLAGSAHGRGPEAAPQPSPGTSPTTTGPAAHTSARMARACCA